MTGRGSPSVPLGFEAFGTACGLAIVAGALSAFAPALSMLTAALAALAVAGWASLRAPAGPGKGARTRAAKAYLLPFVALATAGVLFLDPAAPVGPWRALVLALGLVPLWSVERLRPRTAPPQGRAA